ncbi:MAG: hypothetical protein GY771_16155, partial [bacterium]|nr:hypothetical protein [bacterium]
ITQAAVAQVAAEGYDGIYMDWVEAYSDETVVTAAQAAGLDPAAEMADFVAAIAARGRAAAGPDFGIFPQNGPELTTRPGYLATINGSGNEDVFYGYDGDDIPTPPDVTEYLTGLLDPQVDAGKLVLVADYCTTQSYVDDSYAKCAANGYVGYCAVRDLDSIPDNGHVPTAAESNDCESWNDVGHYLYIINPGNYASGQEFIDAVDATYYDLVIIDAYYDDTILTPAQINSLQEKPDGKRRKVLSYLSIGEAEDYRWYWTSDWSSGNPDWLGPENPNWPGNYKVRYWDPEWQAIIFEYEDKILDAGFDGVYLDIIDGYEYWETNG